MPFFTLARFVHATVEGPCPYSSPSMPTRSGRFHVLYNCNTRTPGRLQKSSGANPRCCTVGSSSFLSRWSTSAQTRTPLPLYSGECQDSEALVLTYIRRRGNYTLILGQAGKDYIPCINNLAKGRHVGFELCVVVNRKRKMPDFNRDWGMIRSPGNFHYPRLLLCKLFSIKHKLGCFYIPLSTREGWLFRSDQVSPLLFQAGTIQGCVLSGVSQLL